MEVAPSTVDLVTVDLVTVDLVTVDLLTVDLLTVDLLTVDLASPKVYQSRASADSSTEKIPWTEQYCVRASALTDDLGSCRRRRASHHHRHHCLRRASHLRRLCRAGRLALDQAKG